MNPLKLLPMQLDCPKCNIRVSTVEVNGVNTKTGEKVMMRICVYCDYIFDVRHRNKQELS
ncbi:MAG: hypothetical protein Q8P20_10520 [bacterium]|nr:hypothetical protein [bacterium]